MEGVLMKSLRYLGWFFGLFIPLGIAAQNPTVAPSGLPCGEAIGTVHFICNLISPEDLAVIPGSEWVIASGNREGGRIHLVNVQSKTATVLFPTANTDERFNSETYPACPGPLNPTDGNNFRAHGLYLKPGQGDIHTLYVVHHGSRESIEIFDVQVATTPTLTWVGCVIAPEPLGFNGVVGLPGGGLVATSPRTGDVWEWESRTGWTPVPGSEDTTPNGLEVSADGRWLYIAGFSEAKLTRLSRGQTPVQKEVIELGFNPDNLRMSLDGSVIFVAGPGNIQTPREPLNETSNVVTMNPATLELEQVFQHTAIEGFVASTTAIQIGNEIWLGTHRGERIAYFSLQ